MPSYTDRTGQVVNVTIDVPAIQRCRSTLGVDLYDLAGLGALAADMIRFLRLIHCVLSPTEAFETWWQRHTGDAGDACVEAFVEALCEMFPTRLAAMIRQNSRLVSEAVEAAWSQLEGGQTDPATLQATSAPILAA